MTPPVVAGLSSDQPAVVRLALLEAERLATSVRLVHCQVAPSEPGGPAVLRLAQEVVGESASSIEVEYSLREGDAGSILVAEAVQAALVVLGARDDEWLHRMLGGDVVGTVVAGAGCPVVVAPASSTAPVGKRSGVVVVTLDGDTSASGPLRFAFEQADHRAEEVHVLHAAPAATSAEDAAALIAQVTAEVARCSSTIPDVPSHLVIAPGQDLGRCLAATTRASMLVIGRPYGHSPLFALARPLAVRVLREARCPVAIIPSSYRSC